MIVRVDRGRGPVRGVQMRAGGAVAGEGFAELLDDDDLGVGGAAAEAEAERPPEAVAEAAELGVEEAQHLFVGRRGRRRKRRESLHWQMLLVCCWA